MPTNRNRPMRLDPNRITFGAPTPQSWNFSFGAPPSAAQPIRFTEHFIAPYEINVTPDQQKRRMEEVRRAGYRVINIQDMIVIDLDLNKGFVLNLNSIKAFIDPNVPTLTTTSRSGNQHVYVIPVPRWFSQQQNVQDMYRAAAGCDPYYLAFARKRAELGYPYPEITFELPDQKKLLDEWRDKYVIENYRIQDVTDKVCTP